MKRYFGSPTLAAWIALAPLAPSTAAAAVLPLFAKAPAPAASAVSELWHKRMSGYVSEVAISDGGGAILVATLPNFDRDDGARGSFLYLYDRKGRLLWRREMPMQVKSMAISADGKVAVATTHDDQISAYSRSGRVLWTVDGTCKPITLRRGDRFLCYHDDDAESRVAFDFYSLRSGRKIYSYPSAGDILALAVSNDEKSFAIGLTGGKVILFSMNGDVRLSWRAALPGEIVDLAVSDSLGAAPRVAALYSRKILAGGKASQEIAVLAKGGKNVAQGALPMRSEEIEWLPGASSVLAYGDDEGQVLSEFSVRGARLIERWRRAEAESANYGARLFALPSQILVGAEIDRDGSRRSAILSFGAGGASRWALPVSSGESAYLYAQVLAPEAGLLAVAMDDGYLALYRLKGGRAAAPLKRRGSGACADDP